MKWRIKILIAIGIVVIAAIVIPVIHHYQLKAEVNAYIAQLKAQGEPLDVAQVIPPPVPAEQNDAPAFLKIASKVDATWDVLESNRPPEMRMIAPGKAMVGWQQPDVRSSDGTNSWREIQAALNQADDIIHTAQQITNRPQLDFNFDYAEGFDNLKITNFIVLRRSALLLAAHAMFNLHQGDAGVAANDIHAILLEANAMQHDRLEISELIQIAIANIASATTWEILQTTNVTDDQLNELQQDWSRFNFATGGVNAQEVERAMGELTLAGWRGSAAGLNPYLSIISRAQASLGMDTDDKSFWSGLKIRSKAFLWRYWWSYPDELRYLKGYEASLNAVRSTSSGVSFLDALQAQNKALDGLHVSSMSDDDYFSILLQDLDFHWLMSQSIDDLSSLNNKIMKAETAQNIVVTAIALKRYQIKYGHYPTNLDSLGPKYLPGVPTDPVNAQPLHYRLNAGGIYLLYSVGENGKDDGGNPAFPKNYRGSNLFWTSNIALDWVWPQPATTEEVQKYYANLGRPN
ncbi:MAG TPA: hypothetical protein VGN23_06345 [Verrucomicrobiae bacterium]|jgi:hypothetical protein